MIIINTVGHDDSITFTTKYYKGVPPTNVKHDDRITFTAKCHDNSHNTSLSASATVDSDSSFTFTTRCHGELIPPIPTSTTRSPIRIWKASMKTRKLTARNKKLPIKKRKLPINKRKLPARKGRMMHCNVDTVKKCSNCQTTRYFIIPTNKCISLC